jgi:hypothetical protein
MPRDLAAIVNCLFCDSYFLFTVYEIDLKDFRRKQGKDVLLDVYEEISGRLNKSGFPYMPCPKCQTLIYEMTYREWLGSDPAKPCALSPCRYIKFDDDEEDVPLYSGRCRCIGVVVDVGVSVRFH